MEKGKIEAKRGISQNFMWGGGGELLFSVWGGRGDKNGLRIKI
jgi:hypothetical protein